MGIFLLGLGLCLNSYIPLTYLLDFGLIIFPIIFHLLLLVATFLAYPLT
ncbi:MAG: hypothetical protein BWY04_00153 [candidate division CPR1 bacterium ADurb.Bin160]|uniref:Uncharacterized protein n=1 Tax=candidate division CPR1 bacterium ADurb.Bin160 TaxID=1852826 RepID=A0A1V5ZQA7_9BACT|nr:MAG: hypothetical protein BWY04_00153 [candidate division CPR1 bacterium ADurb.Bin160]